MVLYAPLKSQQHRFCATNVSCDEMQRGIRRIERASRKLVSTVKTKFKRDISRVFCGCRAKCEKHMSMCDKCILCRVQCARLI